MSQEDAAKAETRPILYRFKLPDGKVKEFSVELDKETLEVRSAERKSLPEWTRLGHFQCTNCPLNEAEHPHCPVAVHLVDVIDFFKSFLSYQEAEVEIVTETRTYSAKKPLQGAIASLMGILMVTSGCPVTGKLKPMVRTHLPFATSEETLYRVIGMYLMAQYFLYKKGKKPDWDLQDLIRLYQEVRIVNESFVKRLASMKVEDASLNAVVVLDCFADSASMSIELEKLGKFEKFFDAYF